MRAHDPVSLSVYLHLSVRVHVHSGEREFSFLECAWGRLRTVAASHGPRRGEPHGPRENCVSFAYCELASGPTTAHRDCAGRAPLCRSFANRESVITPHSPHTPQRETYRLKVLNTVDEPCLKQLTGAATVQYAALVLESQARAGTWQHWHAAAWAIHACHSSETV